MSADLHQIDETELLSPRTETVMVNGRPEVVGNMDVIIELARNADTVQGRRLYSLYRRHKTRLHGTVPTAEKLRSAAMMAALSEAGIPIQEVGAAK